MSPYTHLSLCAELQDGRPGKRGDAALDDDDGLLHLLRKHLVRVAADRLHAHLDKPLNNRVRHY